MLAIVVRLEERDSQIQFEQDAPVGGISAIIMRILDKGSRKSYPMDQTSHGCDHPSSSMTSGAR